MKKLIIIGLILGFNTSAYASKVGENKSVSCTESDQSNRSPKSIVDDKKEDSNKSAKKEEPKVISR